MRGTVAKRIKSATSNKKAYREAKRVYMLEKRENGRK